MKWAQYLNFIGPLFYNQVFYLAFKKSLRDAIRASAPEDEGTSEVEVASLTYEEENAIR